ncbi:MAG: hypothetical protein KDK70_05000 [Myxococcales bacterium]|nr:hypothetical protein [Myxococcales bacterium]
MNQGSRPLIIAHGGNTAHVPESTLQSVIAAYTAGADAIWLRVQLSADGVPVTYAHADLSATTDGHGAVGSHSASALRALQCGLRFREAGGTPWKGFAQRRGGSIPKARIATLEEVWRRLAREVAWYIELLEPTPEGLAAVATMAERMGIDALTWVIDRVDAAATVRAHVPNAALALSADADPARIGRCLGAGIGTLILPGGAEAWSLADQAPPELAVLVCCEAEAIPEQHRARGICARSVLRLAHALRGTRELLRDDFASEHIDRELWVGGISSGHEVVGSILARRLAEHSLGPGVRPIVEQIFDDRRSFEARVHQRDGKLRVSIDEGRRYASAGVVSTITVPDPFQLSVDFEFSNPQVANMMVLAVVNGSAFDRFHQEGSVRNPRYWTEHPVFDSHGTPPFVSVEREEIDGFRIMHNDGNAGLYEWFGNIYEPDVGNGDSRRGKLMLERRGHLFSGYYQDELNDDWVGVGFVENPSVRDRAYVRLVSKHYPKEGARDPVWSNEVSYATFRAITWRRP